MPDAFLDGWAALPVWLADLLLFLALLAPAFLLGALVLRGFAIGPLLSALLRRQVWVSVVFVALIAISVGLGAGLIAQERGLRQGTAPAADKFELVVAAPGSEITAMLAAVYLQPSDLPLLDGETYDRIASHERVEIVAPLGFGDSWRDAPVVGTTAEFVAYLSEGLAEGRHFAAEYEAVAGARVPLGVGDAFSPAHGIGDAAEHGAHGDLEYEVVGRMPLTGSPWDRALMVPIESVWSVHGLANGHGPGWDGEIGPPFAPAYFPGTPAALVRADSLAANYGLQAEFSTETTMAFFPGTVLARLHALMGDIRQAMSVLAVITQVLVTAGVLAGLMMLTRLLAKRLALLRALGAPRRFIFALTWSFAVTLISTGAALGLLLGVAATRAISSIITARTDVLVSARLAWPELHLVAGFVSLTAVLALLPAFLTMNRPVIRDLRG
ncbi:ABC transporter permease [Rhodovulum sp. 12E13]|uniref:FtsX-like permease family protein n=1 Tax=Rhodovulum sp. 12E13 TaxID=2203891 RepID=UPI000E17EF30|nr:FtsX-like permease family protein [Rhodovulum sp. 12E13]RDC69841.1 ABC transporter permease [Rhodovulum sp. 12E13]